LLGDGVATATLNQAPAHAGTFEDLVTIGGTALAMLLIAGGLAVVTGLIGSRMREGAHDASA
jgi:hypothetical protein